MGFDRSCGISEFSCDPPGWVTVSRGVRRLTGQSVNVSFSPPEFLTELHTAGQHGKCCRPPVTGQVCTCACGEGSEEGWAELLHSDLILRDELQVFKGTYQQLWGEGPRQSFSIIKIISKHFESKIEKIITTSKFQSAENSIVPSSPA